MPRYDVDIRKASDNEIREDLNAQLAAKGADVLVFEDLVESYIYYRRLEIEMQRDVADRGLTYKAESAHGKQYDKENPSIKNSVMYSKQCLAILNQLDLTTKNIQTGSDEDDDLL